MDLHLKDKVALVTGSSRGLGAAICLGLAAEGASVVIHDKEQTPQADELVQKIKDTYKTEALAIYADVTKETEVMKMFKQLDEHFGHIDILVNNAAYCPTAQVADMTKEVWDYTLAVNLTGTFLCTREFIKRLLNASRGGRIINISSQAAFRGSTTGHAPYDTSKGGLVSFTVSLARELCEKNIAVNCVAPGIMETEMMAKALKANRQKYVDRIPVKRIAKPEEIANVVVFLASQRASYMTGATVDVSGGLAMR